MRYKLKIVFLFIISLLFSGLFTHCQKKEFLAFPDKKQFLNPDAQFLPHAGLGFDLQKYNDSLARERIRYFYERDFGGAFIEATQGNKGDLPEWYVKQAGDFMKFGQEGMVYLDNDHIRVYRSFLDEAKRLGMRVILYDDYHFPTGQVAGKFYQQFPELAADRLDKVETDFTGSGTINLNVPEGTFLGATLWNSETNEIKDIGEHYKDEKVVCNVADGKWKLMAFYLNHNAVREIRNPGIMNYLEKEATEKFISISYEKFYKGFGEYFGNVIPMSFYDEPSLHWLDGRMWTEEINELYQERYGESPIKYYPALWYDIGEKTAAARNALHGLRAEMFAVNFVKQLNDWCAEHNLKLSGHMDQEEVANPVMCNGDLMKIFKYQDIPGADDISVWGRSNPGYKIVTSSSYNYDKPVTWAETYAVYKTTDKEVAYKVAMDQYAMGINMQTPFIDWLEKVLTVDELISFSNYIGRLSYMLQGGRHVSDIAILYPIAAAQAGNVFGEGWAYGYTGGKTPAELDYQLVGDDLFMGLRIDYTYLHPEVLVDRCVIKGDELILDNKTNREEYKLFILPGGNTINVSAAQKLLEYYRSGGKIIATSRLPIYSAEFGQDETVLAAIEEIFGLTRAEIFSNKLNEEKIYTTNTNSKGGTAYFIQDAFPDQLGKLVDLCLPVRDVRFDEPRWSIGSFAPYKTGYRAKQNDWVDKETSAYKGALTYTHKVKAGKDIYFFANSSENDVKTIVTLRGEKKLVAWDPHSGKQTEVIGNGLKSASENCTTFTLALAPRCSVFLVGD
jgi:hypothetical protein